MRFGSRVFLLVGAVLVAALVVLFRLTTTSAAELVYALFFDGQDLERNRTPLN
jgi:hypothetical protein